MQLILHKTINFEIYFSCEAAISCTYCFDSQALCSKAKLGGPTLDLKTSMNFLKCSIASRGWLWKKDKEQIWKKKSDND